MAAAVLRTDTSVFDLSTKIKRAIQFATTRALSISLAAMVAVSLFVLMERMVRIDEVTFTTAKDYTLSDIFVEEEPIPNIDDGQLTPVVENVPMPPVSPPMENEQVSSDKWGPVIIEHPEQKTLPDIGKIEPIVYGGPKQPRAIRQPLPTYPNRAASAKLSGTCDVFFSLDHTGAPFNISATCSDPVFVTSAERAVRKARFAAATDANGRPIAAHNLVYPLEYRMAD